MSIKYEHLDYPSVLGDEEIEEINVLLRQLYGDKGETTIGHLKGCINYSRVLLARDRIKIVGIARLTMLPTLIDTQGRIEDLVVSSKYKGRRIEESMLKEFITWGQVHGLTQIEVSGEVASKAIDRVYLSNILERKKETVTIIKFR